MAGRTRRQGLVLDSQGETSANPAAASAKSGPDADREGVGAVGLPPIETASEHSSPPSARGDDWQEPVTRAGLGFLIRDILKEYLQPQQQELHALKQLVSNLSHVSYAADPPHAGRSINLSVGADHDASRAPPAVPVHVAPSLVPSMPPSSPSRLIGDPQATGLCSKFKVKAVDVPRDLMLERPAQCSVPCVLKWVQLMAQIDAVAAKAVNREPRTHEEREEYWRIYLRCFGPGLFSEVQRALQLSPIPEDPVDFWRMVLRVVFPGDDAATVYEDTANAYMPWMEMQGLSTYRTSLDLLIRLSEMHQGKQGTALEYAVALRQYRHIVRVINQCADEPSQRLAMRLDALQGDLKTSLSRGKTPPLAQLIQVVTTFYDWLHEWVCRHGMERVFGKSRGTPVPPHRHATLAQPQLRQMQGPSSSHISSQSYAQAVAPAVVPGQENSLSLPGQFVQMQDPPNGQTRTWSYMSRVKIASGPGQELCRGPPPQGVTGFTYLGDWLDSQGLCTYCRKPNHVRSECRGLQAAKEKAAQYRQGTIPSQENSQ
jgi:hypothetical protein